MLLLHSSCTEDPRQAHRVVHQKRLSAVTVPQEDTRATRIALGGLHDWLLRIFISKHCSAGFEYLNDVFGTRTEPSISGPIIVTPSKSTA